MRKTTILIPMLIVFGMVSPLCAAQVFFEDFEGAAVGQNLVTAIPGWSGDIDPLISSVLLDQGQSLDLTAGGASSWPGVEKSFSHVPAASEHYVFSGTLLAPSGGYADARLVASSTGYFVQANVGFGRMDFVMWEGAVIKVQAKIEPQPLISMDFKIVLESNRTDYYYRPNGDTLWTHVGGDDLALDLALYDTVKLVGHEVGMPYEGGVDSISLTSEPEFLVAGDANKDGNVDDDAMILASNWQMTGADWSMGDFNEDGNVDDVDATLLASNWQATATSASTVPEPSTLALLVCGLLCLLPRRRS